ncbi:MAG: amidohydrolase family protein [Pseudomonadota bacterium]
MSNPNEIHVHAALLGEQYTPSGPVVIRLQDGKIASVSPAEAPEGPPRLVLPALVDAHNHARPLSTTSFGCGGRPLEQWLPMLAVIPAVDPYTAAAASFARSLRGGASAVMVHLTRPMGKTSLPDEALEIARAASDVGLSIGFAVSMRDRNPLVYGDHEALLSRLPADVADRAADTWLRPMPSIDDQLALVDAVAEAVLEAPGHVDVQYGPTGVQWCSDALLRAIAVASAHTGRRVHMHLLETKPQRDWADAAYPDGIVNFLTSLGFLSPRLTLAHCVWAKPDELAQIAARQARIAVNMSSNLHLFSGRAPVEDMLAADVHVAMGLDGCALDEDDDGLRELRLFHLMNHSPAFGTQGMTPQKALTAACRVGRDTLGLPPGGILAPGMAADLMVLDLAMLDRDALGPVDPRDLLFARATQGHIVQIWSAGKLVYDKGVLGLDLEATEDALRSAYRASLPQSDPLRAVWPAIEAEIAEHYRGCC